jgi:hypothetical protein
MNRSIRHAPSQEDFDKRKIPVTEAKKISVSNWFRLARVEFPNQFFASPGSRFTPDSGKFPCVYLSESRETTVAEVWGDKFSAQLEFGLFIYVISTSQAQRWAFLRASPLPERLRICDLTQSATRLAVGVDSSALFAPDFRIPQEWASRIAGHPARFDGIQYRSRHTDECCLVLWNREDDRPISDELKFEADGPFLESEAAYALAGKIGIHLSFAS